MYLDYDLELDRNNQAPAGRTHRVEVDVVSQPDVRSVDVDVSYDGGETWRQAQVQRWHGEWRVTVRHPATADYVSLRVEAEGAGAAVTEEIIRAYELR